jgi:hypothetical protein
MRSISSQVESAFDNSGFELSFLELVDEANLSEATHMPDIQEGLVELQSQTLGTPWYKYILGALGVVVIIGGVVYLSRDSIPEPIKEIGSSIVDTTTSAISVCTSWLIGSVIGDGPLDLTGDDSSSGSDVPVVFDTESVTSVTGLTEGMSVDDGLGLNEPLPMDATVEFILSDSASHLAGCAPGLVELPVDLVDAAPSFEVPEVTIDNLPELYGLIDNMDKFQVVELHESFTG